MRVLGLNGWPGRGHDSAACLLVDGRIVAVAEEERFARRKHAYGLAPRQAARFCLDRAGLGLDDVDAVAFGWDVPLLHRDRRLPWARSAADVLAELLPPALFPRARDPELVFVPHHMAHAASVYHFSGDELASVLVLDGQGERESASLLVGRNGKLEVLDTVPVGWSLGYFYDAVGNYIGLGRDQAGKLMGLAAHGTPRADLLGTFTITDTGYEVGAVPPGLRSTENIDDSAETMRAWCRHLAETLPMPANFRQAQSTASPPARDPYGYRDVAATAQDLLERAVFAMTDALVARTGIPVLHVAGGVGFNASLNGKLLEHPAVRRLFVQPLAGDAGVAIGAAAVVATDGGDTCTPLTTSIGWGADFDAATVRRALTDAGVAFTEPADIAAETAKLIAGDAVVGWFQGRSEAGPRALGHRSILANPATRATRDRINLGIKHREWWRPLAPSMAAEHAGRYVETHVDLPYMIVTRPLVASMRDRLAAVDHQDGTTRPQTVSAADEPLYHRLLGHLHDETGVALTVNTSFNGNEEPVVWTPAEALRTFATAGLDALAIGPFLVRGR